MDCSAEEYIREAASGREERMPFFSMRIVSSAMGHPGGDLRRQLSASVLA